MDLVAILWLGLLVLFLVVEAACPLHLVSLWFAWCIFTQIGNNNSFSYENAYHLRNISLLAAADSIFYVVAAIVLAFLKVLHMEVFLVLLGVIFVGVIAAVVTSALSHLTYKAAELKRDSDLTI